MWVVIEGNEDDGNGVTNTHIAGVCSSRTKAQKLALWCMNNRGIDVDNKVAGKGDWTRLIDLENEKMTTTTIRHGRLRFNVTLLMPMLKKMILLISVTMMKMKILLMMMIEMFPFMPMMPFAVFLFISFEESVSQQRQSPI